MCPRRSTLLTKLQIQMHLNRDRRTWTQQATSGVKIAAAIVATVAALALIASAYIRIARLDGGNHVTAGWLLLAAITIFLSATAQYWARWFYFLPGYVAMRSTLYLILGWFSPRGFIFVLFPILMAMMAVLSFRFSKLKGVRPVDRVILMFAFACFLGSFAGFFAQQPKSSALVVAVVGNLALLLERFFVRHHGMHRESGTERAMALPNPDH
jgi:hypothetical protein